MQGIYAGHFISRIFSDVQRTEMLLEALNQITISCINGIETQPDLYFKKYLRNMQVTLVMVLMSLYGTDARQSSADAFVRVDDEKFEQTY